MQYVCHDTAIVDEGAQIGADTRIWHWVHVCGTAVIGDRCSLGQNVYVGNGVQIGDGVYLGQLVYATRHFSLGRIDLPLVPGPGIEFGEAYVPHGSSSQSPGESPDYGYQNNGYFLMLDPERFLLDTFR